MSYNFFKPSPWNVNNSLYVRSRFQLYFITKKHRDCRSENPRWASKYLCLYNTVIFFSWSASVDALGSELFIFTAWTIFRSYLESLGLLLVGFFMTWELPGWCLSSFKTTIWLCSFSALAKFRKVVSSSERWLDIKYEILFIIERT